MAELHSAATTNEILQQKHAENVQTAIAIDTSPHHKDDSKSKGNTKIGNFHYFYICLMLELLESEIDV